MGAVAEHLSHRHRIGVCFAAACGGIDCGRLAVTAPAGWQPQATPNGRIGAATSPGYLLEHELNLVYVALTRAGSQMRLFEGALPGAEWKPALHRAPWAYFMQTSAVTPVQPGTAVEPLFPF